MPDPQDDPDASRQQAALFRHAITLNPERDLAYHGLGVALASQGRHQEAEAAFREYVERAPASPLGFIDLGQLYLSQPRYGEAIPFLRRALAIKPGFPELPGLLARTLRARGDELRRQGRETEGEALLAEAAQLHGQSLPHADQRPGTAISR